VKAALMLITALGLVLTAMFTENIWIFVWALAFVGASFINENS